ncbi:homoserine kinase [Flavihumibacter petaseus]|uniref:Homoserine kinase n=1 Tax=Flavihumibacter petaseus NBRC 106054 TaxID=1220578 RepID=A0A0E9MUQ5_9BACT|nr:homoserine kinase [Flavihumibacter petaseus]GAO41156.1 homoserine kinase [Flavihumibacter petaseus NBRC 106054]
MPNNTVTLNCPATVANMVCGFDILGMALNDPFDKITISLSGEPGIRINHTDEYHLPTEPSKNVAGVALLEMMQSIPEPVGFDMTITKNIKPGSGLGSSAASAAGAVVAANELLGKRFNDADLVRFAMAGEKLASGVKHADNIAPCIMGGITLIRSIFPLDIVRLQAPPLFVTVVHPQIEVKTADARQILRKEVLLKNAIRQWGNIAGLVAGLLQGDYDLIGRSLEDVIIEPVRSILIPGFDQVKQQSREAGALGGGISGSGPSIFMLSRDKATASQIAGLMENIYERLGIDYKTYITTLRTQPLAG